MQDDDSKNPNLNQSKGFKGFNSLATDIDDVSLESNKVSSALPEPETSISATPPKQVNSTDPNQDIFQVTTPKKSYEWGNIIFATLGIIFVAYMIYANSISSPQDKRSYSSSSSDFSQSNNNNRSYSYSNTYSAEIKPTHSANPIYGIGNIQYCLAEKIRVEASKSRLDSADNADIDKFNQYVNDFNYLCGSYRYKQRDFDSASRNIESQRSDLMQQGYDRFPSYGYSR